jgi:hypothetical protein
MDVVAEHAPDRVMLLLAAEMGEIKGLTTRILASMSAHNPDKVSTLEAVFALPLQENRHIKTFNLRRYSVRPYVQSNIHRRDVHRDAAPDVPNLPS